MFHPLLAAWIYWDPDPIAFFIPFIAHPVRWYGLFFVTGLISASLIFLPLLCKKLHAQALKARDISDWKEFFLGLQKALTDEKNPLHKAAVHLKQKSLLKEILSAGNQTHALQIFNAQTQGLSREDIEAIVPKAIYPLQAVASQYMDKLIWAIVIGIVLGARLGHVFFYEWEYYRHHLSDIPKVWQGGLASHGGAVGVLLAAFLYTRGMRPKFPDLTFINLCDLLAMPTCITAAFIRLGNFFNQEIIGQPTTVPWAIVFGHPADLSPAVARHPVQLYEALAYLMTFFILAFFWKRRQGNTPDGLLLGLLFILIFSARFILEFVKAPLGSVFDETFLQTGQILSIPFIIAGFALISLDKLPKLRISL